MTGFGVFKCGFERKLPPFRVRLFVCPAGGAAPPAQIPSEGKAEGKAAQMRCARDAACDVERADKFHDEPGNGRPAHAQRDETHEEDFHVRDEYGRCSEYAVYRAAGAKGRYRLYYADDVCCVVKNASKKAGAEIEDNVISSADARFEKAAESQQRIAVEEDMRETAVQEHARYETPRFCQRKKRMEDE